MKKRLKGSLLLSTMILAAGALLMTGCSGGGGGGGGGSSGLLIGVSFVGFPTVPSTGPTGSPLPSVFRNEVLEFTFDGPLTDGIFGGFITDASGAPKIFRGLSPNASGEVLYFAYQFQAAARNSLQIRQNAGGGPFLPSYVVGRLMDRPDTLVIDPLVSGSNSFGLPSSPGYNASTEYIYIIPATNGILVAGQTAQPIGPAVSSLPLATPPFSPQPGLSLIFFSGASFSPDPIPPEVLSISTLSGALGTPGDPIPTTDGFEIRFSKLVDVATIDQLRNLRVVNNDILTQGATGDPSQVPGNFTFTESDNQTVVQFVPTPGFGPGLGQPPTTGYIIAVRVGSFGDPTIAAILGQPQGNPPVGLPLANSLEKTFITQPTPGAPGSAAYIELFENQDQFDTNFQPIFNSASWAVVVPDGCSGTSLPGLGPLSSVRLSAARICGNPLATTGPGGNPAFLGNRLQFDLTQTVQPTLFPVSTMGLVAPFDDVNQNQTVNPDGGSHLIMLYEDMDIGNNFNGVPLDDSIELVEWGPVQNIVNASCYPSYEAWCGITSNCAPAINAAGMPNCSGLTQNYSMNYDVASSQTPDPNGSGGVLVTAIGSYIIPNNTIATYQAFPVFNPVFDYNPNPNSANNRRNFLIEQNIEPGSGNAPPPPVPPNDPSCAALGAFFNVNRFVAGANFPLRRVFGPPLSIQLAGTGNPTLVSGQFGGWDRYDWRFTWVKAVTSVRSKFYFQNTINDPVYQSMTIIPSPLDQPAGTTALWEIQATDALTISGEPFGPTSPWLTFWNGPARDPNNPAAPTGSFDNSIFPQLSGFKFIRFRVTMRVNHLTPVGNGSFGTFQVYSGVIFNVSF